MDKVSCFVFANGKILVFEGKNTVNIPLNLAGFPIIVSNSYGTKVLLGKPITNIDDKAALRSCILDIIEKFREIGAPYMEFPRWNEMIIYPVEPSSADYAYECPEQVIDSFLGLHGPEYII